MPSRLQEACGHNAYEYGDLPMSLRTLSVPELDGTDIALQQCSYIYYNNSSFVIMKMSILDD